MSLSCKCCDDDEKQNTPQDIDVEEEEKVESSTIISDIETESLGEEEEEEEAEVGRKPQKKRASVKDHRKLITPFFIRWSFGYASKVPLVNLSRPGDYWMAFANTHFVAIRSVENIEKRESYFLKGHTNAVQSICTDAKGEWLASVDAGENNALIVWNKTLRMPVFSQFDFCPGGSASVGLSPDAKYLITASVRKPYTVQMWLWTHGKNSPDDVYLISQTTSLSIKSIDFHPDIPEYFMLSSDDDIFFMSWNGQKLKLDSIPELIVKKRSVFTCSTFVSGTHLAMSCAVNGSVFVWSDVEYCYAFDDKEVKNNKFLIKVMKLENCSITTIVNFDGHIVTGSIKGHIRFYDHDLKLLHWLDKFVLPGLTSISPDIKACYKDYTRTENYSNNEDQEEEQSEELSKASFTQVDYVGKRVSNIYHLPIFSRNFIVGLESGEIGRINFLEDTYSIFKSGGGSIVKSIEVHPIRVFILIGYTTGEIALFNYRSRDRLIFREIVHKEPKGVSCLKFEPNGYFLVAGTENGSLLLLHSCTLEILHTPTYDTRHEIKQIEFTPDSQYLAISDSGLSVSLYRVKSISEARIEFLQRIKSHYKPINCIEFVSNIWDDESKYKLMSIGEDRTLITYDIKTNGIEIRWFERIEQSALPKHLSCQDIDGHKRLIMSNDQIKSINGKPDVLLFYTKTHIGIQKFPLTGNPFDNVALIGHPVEILQGCPNSNFKRFFTFGPLSSEVLMWQVNTRSVDVISKLGGQGIVPFLNLVEGGESGWLFKEMVEFFYFGQILHQGQERELERQVSDLLPICELSDVMNAIGFFPTKYEFALMTYEIMYENQLSGRERNRINFEDMVRLYINHRPAYGISKEQLLKAVQVFSYGGEDPLIDLDTLIFTLGREGESLEEGHMKTFLKFLYKRPYDFYTREMFDSFGGDPNSLPTSMFYSEFEDRILGIDWDFKKITEEYKKSQTEN